MVTKVTRIIFGLLMLFFGLNGFFQFMPMGGGEMPEAAMAFFGGVSAITYFLPLKYAVFIFVGLSMLAKKWVPFALILMAPVSVHIVLYHLFVQPETIFPGLVVFLLNFFLGYKYWDSYKPLFK